MSANSILTWIYSLIFVGHEIFQIYPDNRAFFGKIDPLHSIFVHPYLE